MRPVWTIVASMVAGALWSAVAAGSAPFERRIVAPPLERPHIVNGVFSSQHPSVGALLTPANPATASTWCSGTMIGCETFLTAAHCVCDGIGADCQSGGAFEPDPGDFVVFLQHAGFFSVESIAVHPSYLFPTADVAVLRLTQPMAGVRPSAINTDQSPPAGSTATIVGFGRSGGSNYDYGLKRFGSVETTVAGCDPDQVCWAFENPLGAPGEDSNTCNADSGGPLFWASGTGTVLAGTTSGGLASNCNPYDLSFDADVYFYRSYIQAQGGADISATSCGDTPQVGDAGTTVTAFDGSLSLPDPEDLWTFEVPAGTSTLRVAMNAGELGSTDFDLYIKHGSPASTLSFDCKADGPGQYGFCEITDPSPGTWYALAQRYSGSAAYQITATSLGAVCHPGNEGAPCDDANPCTEDDACVSSVCTGSAVSDGTPCDDGIGCTSADACQAGICGGLEAPRTGCAEPVAPGAATLLLKQQVSGNHLLTWAWRRGEATSKAEFGDPTTGAGYHLCLYDETAGDSSLVLGVEIPPGAAWDESSSGYDYADSSGAADGLRRITFRAGAIDGKTLIKLRAKGAIPLPSLPLAQNPNVTLQLVGESACWESRFSSATSNSTSRFRARSD